jgi:hypothetical protein
MYKGGEESVERNDDIISKIDQVDEYQYESQDNFDQSANLTYSSDQQPYAPYTEYQGENTGLTEKYGLRLISFNFSY